MFRAFDPFRGLALTNAVHHRTDPDLRPPSGTLLCTGHGIFLWPGSPLLAKRGGRFVVRPRDQIYDLVCRLHGPRAAWTPLLPVLEQTAALLNDADVDAARAYLKRLQLPPLSRAGADLMRAIAKRLAIEPPSLPLAPNDNAGLRPDLADGLADAYSAPHPTWGLGKAGAAGDPARLGGPPNAGWFATQASASSAEPVQAARRRCVASAAALAAATPSAKNPVPYFGNHQCVALVRAVADTPPTADWRPGPSVQDGDVPIGTAIATFGPDGRYTNEKATAHAAIYLGRENDGMWVLEQYAGQPPQRKFYPFADNALPIRDGRNYRVIEVAK